ncbi:hypothetical protein AN219_37480 [Streptomyces nanshensis]|nr:hypothetical protein AN219_37480 [Streptomyces nanshensis]
MPLHAQQFFTQHLALPYEGGVVIGNSYYATPAPGSPLRLRIGFKPTIAEHEYDGLRLSVLHPEHGTIDTAVLSFADHDTFTARDDRREAEGFGRDGEGRFREWNSHGKPPWRGAQVEGLTYAIEQYVQLWFPPPGNPTDAMRDAYAPTTSPVPPAPATSKATRRTR